MDSKVEILLSTYNGAKYLIEQIESILNQDYPDWKLIIRDDGSTDSSIKIIKDFKEKYPGKFSIIQDDNGHIGYSKSYRMLLKSASAAYIMFCDQDDYWYPDKITRLLSVIKKEEAKEASSPIVAFSECRLVGATLKNGIGIFSKYIGYDNSKGQQIFFLKNYAPGCSIMFNRVLQTYTLKTDNYTGVHDYWVLMVCSATGKIIYVDEPLMDYRLHDDNAIGLSLTQKVSWNVFIKNSIKYIFRNKRYRNIVYSKNIEQMRCICNTHQEFVNMEAKKLNNINESNYFTRKFDNIVKPFIIEKTFIEQLSYILFF